MGELAKKIGTIRAAEDKPKAVGKEVGVSGNRGAWGHVDTGEYLDKLQGDRGRSTYDEMRRSDPQIRAVLQAINLPLRQANYYFDPVDDTPGEIERAEQISDDFFKNMTMTWDDTLRHVLLMFPFGFSPLEKVWELRDGMVRPRKFDPRLPQSVVEWKYDESKRRLTDMVQMDHRGQKIEIPIEKLLVFTNEKEGDNWEGISLLRYVYKPWMIKNDMEKINAIKHDRWGVGVPTMEPIDLEHAPQIQDGTDTWDDTVEILENMQANEQSYVFPPFGYRVRIISPEGSAGTDVLPTIQYYDQVIARGMLAMFIMLGQTDTGSRALGGEFTDVFRLSIQAYADYICEVFNRFAVKQYVAYNWGAGEYPTMKVRRIQRLDPQTLAVLKNAGLIGADIEIENAIRDELNLPLKEEEEEPDVPEPPEEAEPDEDAAEEDEDVAASDPVTFAERQLTTEEMLCDFPTIELALDSSTETLTDRLLRIRSGQVEKIIMQLVAGRRVQEIGVPGNGDMFSILIKAYKDEFQRGREQVQNEIRRQRPEISLAERPMPDLDELFALVEEELQIRVQGASDKLKTIIAAEYLNLRKRGFTGDQLAAELRREAAETLSDVTLQETAQAAVNQGWGAGRQVVVDQYANDVDYVYRSALMDRNTCEVCSAKDGITHEPDDPEYMTPDPACLGAPKCRCINIAVMKAESAPEGEA